MTFDEQHPYEEVGHEIEPHVFKSAERAPCWECKRYTNYIDIDFLVHLCSKACVEVEWMKKIRQMHNEAHPVTSEV